MKKGIIVLVLIAGFLGSMALAQPPGKDKEKMKAMKIAFLTEKLSLTPEEAQKFWPVYNQYQEELKVVRKDMRAEKFNARSNEEDITDKQAEEMLEKMLQTQQAEMDITRKYVTQFKQVLPVKKVTKLFLAEHSFKKRLMNELKGRSEGPHHQDRPGENQPGHRGGGR